MKKITMLLALMCFSLGYSQTFTSTGPFNGQPAGGTALTCGTANELNLPLAVTGIGTLGDVNVIQSVTVNITHTWNADVRLTLIAPDGTTELDLINAGVGGNGDGFTNCIFADGGANLPTANTTPVSGTFAPQGAGGFAALNAAALNADGDWTLNYCDAADGDVGVIQNWSVTFVETPPTDVLDYYNLQFPATGNIALGSSFDVYAQLYQAGVTDTSSDPAPGVEVWIGINSSNVAPTAAGWTWLPATFNSASGSNNNDEYSREIGSTRPIGTYYYASRFRYNNSSVFTYGGIQPDASFGGTWGDNGNISGVLTVSPPPPPANDDCDNAIALTVNANYDCGTVTAGTTVSATASSQATTGLSGTANNDVWFSFVATGAAHRVSLLNVVAVIGTSTDMGMGVYNADGGCEALVFTATSDPNTLNLTGLTAGSIYYVRVYGWAATNSAQANFDICIGSPPPPPANNDFANALPVTCGNTYIGSTALATSDNQITAVTFGVGTNNNLTSPNVWYSYTGTGNPEAITLSLCNSGYDTAILVGTGTPGNMTWVAGNDDFCGTNGWRSQTQFSSDGTTTYYIMVRGYGATSTGTYELVVTCTAITPPPANNECAAAEALAFTVPATGTTIGATQNGAEEQPTCDTFGAIADVWYSIDLASAGDLSVITTLGTATEANIAVYSVCGGLVADSLGCADDTAGEELTLTGLDAGTYYIRVWNNGGSEAGTFNIVADFTLSSPELSIDAFTYFPNPVKNTLQLNAQSSIQNVSIYNMLGQEVLRTAPNNVNSTLDMSALQAGAYFVKVTINDRTETVRVIKQ